MSRFNFNEIVRENKADINKIGENFQKIENNALSIADIVNNLQSTSVTKPLSAKQGNALANLYVYENESVTLRFSASNLAISTKIIEVPSGHQLFSASITGCSEGCVATISNINNSQFTITGLSNVTSLTATVTVRLIYKKTT